MRRIDSEENCLFEKSELFNLNILKKVEIKPKSIDFNKHMSVLKMRLETERKSICDFMNCWQISCTACKE
jgi:hypothetical protein